MSRTLLLCDCMGSQSLDAGRIEHASGLPCSRVHTALCMDEIGTAAEAISAGETLIACQQERQRFLDLASELGAPEPGFVDLRDRAGWFDGQGDATPKMAALAAEAALPMQAAKSVDVVSEGVCLVLGPAEVACAMANYLADTLAVTVLITDDGDSPESAGFDVVRGTLKHCSGALGGFSLRIDALQEQVRGGRGAQAWTAPKDGAASICDIIIDLRGGTPLFPAHEKREGYLRADPRRPEALTETVANALKLVGTFEKPLYVRLEPSLCAHSRAEQTGCTRCLDLCPTSAIVSAGENVSIDPMACAGCGSCAAACPSGAISYDAPPVETLMRRVQALASTYRTAGGTAPRLLVHDAWGTELIALAARYGDGLPCDVIPLETDALSSFGHAEIMGSLGAGFTSATLLCGPKAETDAIEAQVVLARALAPGASIDHIAPNDPDSFAETLRAQAFTVLSNDTVLPMGNRRQMTRLAAKVLNPEAEVLELPKGAPYGAVIVDTDACTLCLSCVSLCPSGALADNSDLPQLRFQEDACLQCGLCATICPEKAIELKPQMNLTDAALSQEVLNEEEPFACVECGSLFGVKSTVERIMEKLAGTHSMFKSSDAARMIQMCDNCRIQAQFHSENSPFSGGERPRVRTTEDYLSKRRDH